MLIKMKLLLMMGLLQLSILNVVQCIMTLVIPVIVDFL